MTTADYGIKDSYPCGVRSSMLTGGGRFLLPPDQRPTEFEREQVVGDAWGTCVGMCGALCGGLEGKRVTT